MVYTDLKKYDGHTQIQSPHDPEARYSRKRHFEWVGDKVQVTETEDEGYPHIITDMVATSSNRTDYEELPAIQARLEQRELLARRTLCGCWLHERTQFGPAAKRSTLI